MKTTTMTVLFFFLAIWFAGTVESAPAPAPAVDCLTLITTNLFDCISYVSGNNTVKTPEGTCCSGLKTVLKTDAGCLCEVFKNSSQLGIPLDLTKALALPSACNVSAPSVSNCALSLLAPGPAPVGTVGNTPTTTPPSSGSVAFSAFIGSLVMVLIVASFTLV